MTLLKFVASGIRFLRSDLLLLFATTTFQFLIIEHPTWVLFQHSHIVTINSPISKPSSALEPSQWLRATRFDDSWSPYGFVPFVSFLIARSISKIKWNEKRKIHLYKFSISFHNIVVAVRICTSEFAVMSAHVVNQQLHVTVEIKTCGNNVNIWPADRCS